MSAKPNAVECVDCGAITDTDDPTEVCGSCLSPDTVPVVVSDCPSDPSSACNDEDHHFGLNKHVEEA